MSPNIKAWFSGFTDSYAWGHLGYLHVGHLDKRNKATAQLRDYLHRANQIYLSPPKIATKLESMKFEFWLAYQHLKWKNYIWKTKDTNQNELDQVVSTTEMKIKSTDITIIVFWPLTKICWALWQDNFLKLGTIWQNLVGIENNIWIFKP